MARGAAKMDRKGRISKKNMLIAYLENLKGVFPADQFRGKISIGE
jgi:hypothetical protein